MPEDLIDEFKEFPSVTKHIEIRENHRQNKSTFLPNRQADAEMSHLQDYLIPLVIYICIEIGLSTVNILLNFAENFPHTAARYQHWLYLISDDNLDHWNLKHLLLVALLPAYLILFWERVEILHSRSRAIRRTFGAIKQALFCSWVASKSYSIFVMLYIGWSVPPGGSKLMTWMDLWLESTLTTSIALSLCCIPFFLSSLETGFDEFV